MTPARERLASNVRRLHQLATVLVEHIRAWGPITFAKYMDACLYDPQHGYYTRADQLPRRDYFTSVDASPIFGRLLARQFQEMWVQLGPSCRICTRGTWRGGRKPGGTSFGFHRRVVSRILQRPAVRGSRALRHSPHRRCRDARAAPRRPTFRHVVRHARRNSLRLHFLE